MVIRFGKRVKTEFMVEAYKRASWCIKGQQQYHFVVLSDNTLKREKNCPYSRK
jgi:hypothetical protein